MYMMHIAPSIEAHHLSTSKHCSIHHITLGTEEMDAQLGSAGFRGRDVCPMQSMYLYVAGRCLI